MAQTNFRAQDFKKAKGVKIEAEQPAVVENKPVEEEAPAVEEPVEAPTEAPKAPTKKAPAKRTAAK